jgi:hypothetical protein
MEKMGDDFRPALNIGQPVNGAPVHEDNIERFVYRLGRFI